MAQAQATPAAETPAAKAEVGEVVVTGIRGSLRKSSTIKRQSQGVVDAISAEEMGKFPDTNLAESLQRITGVSIDRSMGEGSFVTVRGFGPDFNLIILNGRQMPTSQLSGGATAPSSRSFDFGNLASEGISAVEVYKSGRATLESGGIGSTINIRTARPLDKPGQRGTIGVKGVLDTSGNYKTPLTPEVSGIYSNSFADDRVGVLISGSYQKREGGNNEAYVGWKDGYVATDPKGQLSNPQAQVTNRPTGDSIYSVPVNSGIGINNFKRERINGQLVLQFKPVENVTATLDYTYSRNTVETRNNSVGVYFNHNATSSDWTSGQIAAPNFYTETFKPGEKKDLSYVSNLTANRSENKSLGANVTWKSTDGHWSLEADAHNSTAESKPTNQYGTSTSVSTAIYGVASQTIDFRSKMPILSYTMAPGLSALDPSLIQASGNSFRNGYFRDEITQGQIMGGYRGDGLLNSVDVGVSYVENKVRSAYGFIQNNTWAGAGPASDLPDSLFTPATIPDKFPNMGVNGANLVQTIYTFNFKQLVPVLDQLYKVCGNKGSCLAPYTVDRRIVEKTFAPYAQAKLKFDLFGRPAGLIGGLRYEKTTVDSSALVPIPTGTQWVSNNEFNVVYSGKSDFTKFKGSYDNWLPAIDFDIEPMKNVKLRASYSHTITRADYGSLQGGRTIDSLFRIDYGSGSQGNPGLEPYLSKNIDLSAEWYYQRDSFASIGFFHKDVENFLSSKRVATNAFGLTNPANGPRYKAALAALGANASITDIRQYILTNYPNSSKITGGTPGAYLGNIDGLPEDGLVTFQINTPVNSDQTASVYGWEFAVQHSFWDTGFGVIANYTIVDGDVTYDNTKPATSTQFALTGLSNTANLVGFYDKNGIQARIAYNWRDEFLAGNGPNPGYTEAYGQVDANASYEIKPGLTIFAEGINLTNEGRRGHQRSKQYVTVAAPGFARYTLGVRYKF